ncbi:glycoprotein [Mossuril virus]|uniref:Glycoprotein n=1 Tax=Mossuril virus TaxID=200404 RepID=A0A0D3R102_9RHAB|nr:glycoprotein [Mossuril virus]AJR28354.1 glycoprotein [Mossuril virus]
MSYLLVIILIQVPRLFAIFRDTDQWYVRLPHDKTWFDNILTFPIHCKEPWQPITSQNLNCPSFNNISVEAKASFKIGTVHHPLTSSRLTVDGYLCHKQSWVSQCVETWYFSTTETNTISNLPITRDECEEAITTYEMGEYTNPFFPPFYCSWCSTQTDQKTFVIVEPHSVREDVYNGTFVDPLFIGGSCRLDYCNTIHPNVLWVPRGISMRKDVCNQKLWESGTVFGVLEEKEGDMHYGIEEQMIRSSIYGVRRLEGACYRGVCGRFGIRFPSGEWWGLSGNEVVRWVLRILKRCEKGERVSLSHDNHDERMAETQELMRTMMCENVRSRILSNDPISPNDLNYLLPVNPGIGQTYRVFKRILTRGDHGGPQSELYMEQRPCMYRIIHNVSKIINQTSGSWIIGQLFDGTPVQLNNSIFDRPNYLNQSDGRSRDGWYVLSYNGLIKYRTTLYTPSAVENGAEGLGFFKDRTNLLLLDSPRTVAISNQMELVNNIYTSIFHSNTTSVFSKVESAIRAAKNAVASYFSQLTNIAWWVGTGCIGIIALLIWKRCHCYNLLCKKTSQPAGENSSFHVYDTIEMRPRKTVSTKNHPPKPPPKKAHGKSQGHSYFQY